MRVFCLLIAATFLVACGTTTTTNAGGTGPRGSALEDGGVGSGEIPLPDLTTEPKRDVSFPGSQPFTYDAFAVGGDGALTVCPSSRADDRSIRF